MALCECNQGRLPCSCKGHGAQLMLAEGTVVADRDGFEVIYAEYTGRDIDNVQAQRMGDSYGQPKIATAWRWYQIGTGVAL